MGEGHHEHVAQDEPQQDGLELIPPFPFCVSYPDEGPKELGGHMEAWICVVRGGCGT